MNRARGAKRPFSLIYTKIKLTNIGDMNDTLSFEFYTKLFSFFLSYSSSILLML